MPRKYLQLVGAQSGSALASMRPGRMPRKYLPDRLHALRTAQGASMRPGRMPRKYVLFAGGRFSARPRFNEAGADAPEIRNISATPLASKNVVQ